MTCICNICNVTIIGFWFCRNVTPTKSATLRASLFCKTNRGDSPSKTVSRRHVAPKPEGWGGSSRPGRAAGLPALRIPHQCMTAGKAPASPGFMGLIVPAKQHQPGASLKPCLRSVKIPLPRQHLQANRGLECRQQKTRSKPGLFLVAGC